MHSIRKTSLLRARWGDPGVEFRVGGDILLVGTQGRNGKAEERKRQMDVTS